MFFGCGNIPNRTVHETYGKYWTIQSPKIVLSISTRLQKMYLVIALYFKDLKSTQLPRIASQRNAAAFDNGTITYVHLLCIFSTWLVLKCSS